jgi:hypothetical protein
MFGEDKVPLELPADWGEGGLPSEHGQKIPLRPQCQGNLLISGRGTVCVRGKAFRDCGEELISHHHQVKLVRGSS